MTSDIVCARRSPTTIRVREAHVEKLNKLSEMEYEILHVLEFNRLVLSSSVHLVVSSSTPHVSYIDLPFLS